MSRLVVPLLVSGGLLGRMGLGFEVLRLSIMLLNHFINIPSAQSQTHTNKGEESFVCSGVAVKHTLEITFEGFIRSDRSVCCCEYVIC